MPKRTTCKDCGCDINDETRGASSHTRCKPCTSKYVRERQRVALEKNPFRYISRVKKSQCKTHGIVYTLSEEYLKDLWEQQDGKCAALGIPLDLSGGSRRDETASIDRIVPEKGYTQGNVKWLSWVANRVKSNITDPTVFEGVAEYVRSNQ